MPHAQPKGAPHRDRTWGMGPIINGGDLIRAFKILKPLDSATCQAIAEMLGFQWSMPESQSPVGPKQPNWAPIFKPAKPLSEYVEPKPSQLPPSGDWSEIKLDRAGSEPIVSVDDMPAATLNIATVDFQTSNPALQLPEMIPLFNPGWTRAIISTTLATQDNIGAVNIDMLIDMIARREHVEKLPRDPVLTLRRGVQLLVDKSRAMMPFARDQIWLQTEIQRIVGDPHLSILRFAGCPLRGAGKGNRSRWADYIYPMSGTVILVITDLGIAQPLFAEEPGNTSEWQTFCAGAITAGCPVVAFVPYAKNRWPQELIRSMTIIEWDRQTSTAGVRRQVGYGHKVKR